MTVGGDSTPHILVIKLAALGDFVQALGPCAAIRQHHKDARITLLTTAPFEDLARQSGYFDEVWLDTRPKLWQPSRWMALRRKLKSGAFERVYDLQTSDRSGFYFKLLAPGPNGPALLKAVPTRTLIPSEISCIPTNAKPNSWRWQEFWMCLVPIFHG